MDELNNNPDRPVPPARKKRSKMQIFKEVYLPVLIAGIAVLLVVTFVIGSIVRAVQKNKLEKEASIAASASIEAQKKLDDSQAKSILEDAAALADGFDFAGAIALIDTFQGDIKEYPELTSKRDEYVQLKDTLVAWDDPNKVLNLSFQLLIADPERAYASQSYGSAFRNNFITTAEFSAILQQLYDNNYVLVRMEDFIDTSTDSEGNTTYTAKTMYLPSGKKPLMLTQTNVNYNQYLVDSDGDMIPDAGGLGFASKLVLENGNITCEMVDSSGQTTTGAYDLVPILDEFVAQHPDFSYRGAKATLALTGYNGLFGYRTDAQAKDVLGEDAHKTAVQQAKDIAAALTANGYTLACYTYENIGYGSNPISTIQEDLSNWNAEVVPILGGMDILVYAMQSDISSETTYSGEKYQLLKNSGFNYYLGFCNNGYPWVEIGADYVRQGRILVGGSALQDHAEWFNGMFDAGAVLDPARSN